MMANNPFAKLIQCGPAFQLKSSKSTNSGLAVIVTSKLNFEQNTILKAARSNNELDTTKLLRQFPQVPSARESIIKVFERMHKNIRNS